MYINVFDTHVHTRDGRYLHFDVFTDSNDLAQARHYAQQFLKQNNIEEDNISQSSCAFCHSESSSPEVEQAIGQAGYYIFKMQGCQGMS
ncbi:DUF2024 family protein [Serratia liquefaciens]|jgi:predicted Abi (CAAX) family protease|uniref:DUF2024 family protein n=1 Tax=Serratia liquefaciens TaxID=614 RepID=A0A515CWN9_SERLI|nr:DUF2024 family protein [Serratia liquefaciens]QDL32585.1 DUF2024 family protein [Serratia liquefaciens]